MRFRDDESPCPECGSPVYPEPFSLSPDECDHTVLSACCESAEEFVLHMERFLSGEDVHVVCLQCGERLVMNRDGKLEPERPSYIV
ncbi:MAG: hypothetical protein QXP81_09905 [Nitrososphaerota archaeon]